ELHRRGRLGPEGDASVLAGVVGPLRAQRAAVTAVDRLPRLEVGAHGGSQAGEAGRLQSQRAGTRAVRVSDGHVDRIGSTLDLGWIEGAVGVAVDVPAAAPAIVGGL